MRNRKRYSAFIPNVNAWKQHEEDNKGRMLRLIQFCVENDISSFKFVPVGTKASDDDNFGIAVAESGLDRAEIELISEYEIPPTGFSKESLFSFVENTILRLHTDYLDLLFLKNVNLIDDEVEKAIQQLKDQGKIAEIGSTWNPHAKPNKASAEALKIDFSLKNFNESYELFSEFNQEKKNVFLEITAHADGIQEKSKWQRLENLLFSISAKYQINHLELLHSWILKQFTEIHLFVDASDEEELLKCKKLDKVAIKDRDFKFLSTAILEQ